MSSVSNRKTALATRLGGQKIQIIAERCATKIGTIQTENERMWRERDNYLLQSLDNFDWRKTLGERDSERPSAIFAKQNDSLNIIGGFSEYLSAKTVDDLMGSEPYFALLPEGRADKKLAETMQRHSEWRIRKSDLDHALATGIRSAYDLGEQVVKIIYSQRYDYYEQERRVLIDPATQEYVLTSDGKNIFAEDEIILTEPQPQEEQEDIQPQDGQMAKSPGPYPGDPGSNPGPATTPPPDEESEEPQFPHATKDPTLDLTPYLIEQPDGTRTLTFSEAFVEESKPCGEPIEVTAIHHRDFICSNTSASLQKSDFIAHVYDLRLSKAKEMWGLSKDVVDRLKDDTDEPKSAMLKAAEGTFEKDGDDEAIVAGDERDPLVQFAECFLPITVNNQKARTMFIVAVKEKLPIFCDYLRNVTPDGGLPFFVLRPFPVKNRWYGRGFYEIYDYAQQFIERQLNYVAYRNRHHANPIRLTRRDLIINVEEGQDIPVSPDTGLELHKNADPRQAISFVEYPDLDQRTWDLLQLMMQVVQLRSGITSAAQGGVESLPQNSTATGIEAILNSGNTIHRLPIRCVRKQIESALIYCLKLIYSNMDEKEVFTYLEGENLREITLAAKDIENISFDIRLTMTRFRQKEQRESAKEALAAIDQYLNATQEPDKSEVRPLYIDILKSLGIQDAERIVRPPAPPQAPTPPPL